MNSASGGNVIFNFTGDDSKLKSTMGNLVKSFTLGNLATKAISKGMQTLTENIGSAVSRFDQVKKFPKIMENLGVSTEDSKKAIDKLTEKLKGLPTTLDSATAGVQRLVAKNGDVGKSTDMFLALNNAIISGNAPMQVQSSAIEQLTQAYSKGKPDMIEWKSIMSAMPGQMKQLATAFQYNNIDEFGEDLRNGTIPMDEFMDKMIELNEKGVAGFDSFENQAKNSVGGIETSFVNMRTAIVRGITNMIEKVNQALEPYGGLSKVISELGKIGEQVFTKLGDILGKVIPKLIDLYKFWKKNKTIITGVAIAVGSLYVAFKTLKTISTIVNTINAFRFAIVSLKTTAMLCGGSISTLNAILQVLNLTFLANPIFWVVAAIIALIAIVVLLYTKCDWFRNFINGAVKQIMTIVKAGITVITSIIKGIIDFIANNWQGLLLFLVNPFAGAFKLLYDNCEGFRNFINNFINGVVNFFKELPGKLWNIFLNVISKVSNWLNDMKTKATNGIKNVSNAIVNGIKSLPDKMLNIGKNIVTGLFNGVNSMKNWILSKIKGFASGIIKGFQSALGIHSPSRLMAQSVGRFIPEGIAVGISANADSLNSAINEVQKDLITALNPNIATGMSLSPNIIVNNNIDVQSDPLGQTVRNIKTFANGSKNDYNYGSGY